MTREEQVQFVSELIESVKKTLLANVGKVPEEWDGAELRQWIADKFSESVYRNMLIGKRLREYENTVLVNNL